MKKTPRLLFWTLFTLIAFLTLLEIFSLPSSTDKVWLFGLSVQRFMIALFPLTSILFCVVMITMVLFIPDRYEQLRTRFRQVVLPGAALSGIISFWASLFLSGVLIYYRLVIAPNVVTLTPKLGALFPNLCAYMDRLWALLMFFAFCMACWTIYVWFGLKQPLFQNLCKLIGWGVGVLSIFGTLFQWIVFIFHLHVFEQIPGWYWPIILKPNFFRNALIFGIFLLFFILILVLIQRFPHAHILNLSLICLAFIGLQYTLGYMEGRGLASLTDRFFLSYHRIYTEEACNATYSSHEAIVHYEDLYTSMFLQTKPPGVVWMSFKLNQIANLPGLSSILDQLSGKITLSKFIPRMTSVACQRSMVLRTLLFPLLSASTIWVIYGVAKWLIRGKEYTQLAYYSALLFILSPNILMLTMFLDQALYPALFLLIAGATLLSIQRKSFTASFLIGFALYITIFLSFSMLPLLALPIIYFLCVSWQGKNFAAVWEDFKKSLLPIGLGGLLSMLLFKIFLNYDIFTRYQHMMATRIEGDFYIRLGISPTREATFLEKIHQTWDAILLNNIELAVAIGFPIFIFFIVMGIYSLIRVIQRKPDATAAINASLFLTYGALNAFRAVLGEVGRLWMFWIPVMTILTIQYLLPIIRRNRWIMYLLMVLQLTTVFLTYQFQDYLMPQLLP